MRGCGADGKLNESRYTEPLPWIGAYVAIGTLYCAGAMALDAYSGFRQRKFWFPTKFFSLNATTLTMIAIATKFPVDLNTSMPKAADQLTKLSGTVLICTVTANFMPSLGDMGDSEVASNVVALGILVVTVFVNIGIQMGTGVIFAFVPEHVIVMILMLVVLALLVSSALPIATTKHLLEEQYLAKHQDIEAAAEGEEAGGGGKEEEEDSLQQQKPVIPLDKLKGRVKRYWLMAHTCNPQYVLGRSATCTASGAFCLVAAVILLQALLRSLRLLPGSTQFCGGASDYGWSTTLVLAVQVAAVVIGTVAPAYRWFYAINFRSIRRRREYDDVWTCADEFTVEKYWVQRLREMKEAPLRFESGGGGKSLRRAAQDLQTCSVSLLIRLQKGVVLASKFIRLLSVFPVHWLQEGGRIIILLKRSSTMRRAQADVNDDDLNGYVLHLEGEDDLVRLITKSGLKDTDVWVRKGRNSPPAALMQLIRDHSTLAKGFIHAGDFLDASPGVPPLLPKEPPNCWSLLLVTLAAVAAALPAADRREVRLLLRGVREGLRFVKLVEENLDDVGLVNMRGAAESVWMGLELYNKWLDRDLRSLAPPRSGSSASAGTSSTSGGGGKKVAEAAMGIAKKEFDDAVSEHGSSTHVLSLPERAMAANCMYWVCATVLNNRGCEEEGRHPTDADLLAWLRTAIADVLGACLTNLPRTLYMETFSHKVEVREKRVRVAALALGETEDILRDLEKPEVAPLFPSKTQYLDDWKKGERECRDRCL